MRLVDQFFRHVPEYYDTMYLDGFKPEEIMYAKRKQMYREFEERERKQREQKELEKLVEAEIMRQAEPVIEKALEDLLKSFK